jgi:hypothetical protein
VYAEDSSFDKALVSCTAPSENQRVFRFSHPLERIQAIGQNGKVLASSQNTDTLLVELGAQESYARVEALDKGAQLLLNPMVRYDGRTLPQAASLRARPNPIRTWSFRLLVLGSLVGILWMARWVRTRG